MNVIYSFVFILGAFSIWKTLSTYLAQFVILSHLRVGAVCGQHSV